MWASGKGHTDVVQLLLTSGAQVDLQNKVRHKHQLVKPLRAEELDYLSSLYALGGNLPYSGLLSGDTVHYTM